VRLEGSCPFSVLAGRGGHLFRWVIPLRFDAAEELNKEI